MDSAESSSSVDDFNVSLIDLVSNHQIIYNHFHPEHKNRQALKIVGVSSRRNSTLLVLDFCQKRWRTLRTLYGKKHKKKLATPSGSGVSAPEKWPYYTHLSFLDSYVKHRSSVDNFGSPPPPSPQLSVAEESETQESQPLPSPAGVQTSELQPDEGPSTSAISGEPSPADLNPKKRKRKENTPVENEMFNFLKESRQSLATICKNEGDEFDDFGKFVASQLRNKPYHVAKMLMRDVSNHLFSDIQVITLNSEQSP